MRKSNFYIIKVNLQNLKTPNEKHHPKYKQSL